MIRSLRAYFLARALREKLLLVAFVAIGLLWWLSAYSARAGTFWRAQHATTVELRDQAQWIRNKSTIEQTAESAAAKLDSTKTLNAIQLATTLQRLANDAGLQRHNLASQPVTKRTGQFAIHTATYNINSAEWVALVNFYDAVQLQAPYIAVDVFTLSAAANNPAQLSLSLRAESVEIVR